MWQKKWQCEVAEGEEGQMREGQESQIKRYSFIWNATKNYEILFIKGLTRVYISIQRNYCHDYTGTGRYKAEVQGMN